MYIYTGKSYAKRALSSKPTFDYQRIALDSVYGLEYHGFKALSNHDWLVVDLPLRKIWLRQLGWWNSQLNGESQNSIAPNHQPDEQEHQRSLKVRIGDLVNAPCLVIRQVPQCCLKPVAIHVEKYEYMRHEDKGMPQFHKRFGNGAGSNICTLNVGRVLANKWKKLSVHGYPNARTSIVFIIWCFGYFGLR